MPPLFDLSTLSNICLSYTMKDEKVKMVILSPIFSHCLLTLATFVVIFTPTQYISFTILFNHIYHSCFNICPPFKWYPRLFPAVTIVSVFMFWLVDGYLSVVTSGKDCWNCITLILGCLKILVNSHYTWMNDNLATHKIIGLLIFDNFLYVGHLIPQDFVCFVLAYFGRNSEASLIVFHYNLLGFIFILLFSS